MLNRRTFLSRTAGACAGAALPSSTRQLLAASAPLITPRLGAGAAVHVPANFIGLGYEMSSISSPGLLSENNHRYVALIKGLGTAGVLRAGGIVADYSRYQSNGTARADRQDTVLTRGSLEQLAALLKRVGWSAIWSVNFAQGSIEEAISEARAVQSILGPSLLALELGNEVENYGRGEKPFRKPPYDYETFRAEYSEWHAAILKAVPGISFAAPDTASSVEWVERMAKDAGGEVQLLTTHYYRNNQQHGTVEQLLSPDPKLEDLLVRLREASRLSKIPWRMCETNSFSGGGRPGISDTLAGALWTLDYLLLLATYGCSGVNIETGVNQLGFVSSYSPIQDNGKGLNTAGAPYYGMLAFASALAGSPEMLPIDLDTGGVDITVYVSAKNHQPHCIAAVNRDRLRDAHLSIAELGLGAVSVFRLSGPSLGSHAGTTFGGSEVGSDGHWTAKTEERIQNGSVTVPRMSAAVLHSIAR